MRNPQAARVGGVGKVAGSTSLGSMGEWAAGRPKGREKWTGAKHGTYVGDGCEAICINPSLWQARGGLKG